MNGKPVLHRNARTVLTRKAEKFGHKMLCDGLTLNLGDACGFGCAYCYVGPQMLKLDKPALVAYRDQTGTSVSHCDVVIRRCNALGLLEAQLVRKNGTDVYHDPLDQRVVFSSTTVDPAANMTLLRETAAACNLIFRHTSFQLRLLSKSALLAKLVTDGMIPAEHHHRLILGFSIGTLDDQVAAAIEHHASRPSARLKALHELQDRGLRTFGMICPSLPQSDYAAFSGEICKAIRAERCEHVWAEVINVRGKSLTKTSGCLRAAGLKREAVRLERVSGPRNREAREAYARQTFLAHAKTVRPEKLRFLQYIDEASADWWRDQKSNGAVLIGKVAEKLGLVASGAPPAVPPPAVARRRKSSPTRRGKPTPA